MSSEREKRLPLIIDGDNFTEKAATTTRLIDALTESIDVNLFGP